MHFEKIYDTALDTTLYTKFKTSIEITALHYFTLCNIKEYPEESNGLVFCYLLKKKWFKLVDVEKQNYVDLAQSRSKHKVGKWTLELYKIIESTLSKHTIKSIELRDPMIGMIAHIVFGHPRFQDTLKNLNLNEIYNDNDMEQQLAEETVYGEKTTRELLFMEDQKDVPFFESISQQIRDEKKRKKVFYDYKPIVTCIDFEKFWNDNTKIKKGIKNAMDDNDKKRKQLKTICC